MTKGPCENCAERKPLCWGECERYKVFREKLENEKAVRNAAYLRKRSVFKGRK